MDILVIPRFGDFTVIGQTLNDALGEAFFAEIDKAAIAKIATSRASVRERFPIHHVRTTR